MFNAVIQNRNATSFVGATSMEIFWDQEVHHFTLPHSTRA